MRFTKGASVAPIEQAIPVRKLVQPGHAIHARMLASEGEGEKHTKPFMTWSVISLIVSVGVVVAFAGARTANDRVLQKMGQSPHDAVQAKKIGAYALGELLLQSSHADTSQYKFDAIRGNFDPEASVDASPARADLDAFIKESLAALNQGKGVQCSKAVAPTSKPWHNNFDYTTGPFCSNAIEEPVPHQWVWSVTHEEGRYGGKLTSPWLGFFFKGDGVWKFQEVALSGRRSDHAIGVDQVFDSLIADFGATDPQIKPVAATLTGAKKKEEMHD